MMLGEFLSHKAFDGFVVLEYFNLVSMRRSAMKPAPIQEYRGEKNNIEDIDKIIIRPKKKLVELLVHDDDVMR